VTGTVASPTFVIAREHPSAGDGPALVHVDAYRLGGPDGNVDVAAELDDLDLDTELDRRSSPSSGGSGSRSGSPGPR
jgi:tRNA threonylcarbamoyladenosine biosynthesis protein TsaE